MARNTPQYLAIIQTTSKLVSAVKNDLVWLSGKLVAKQLITADQGEELRNSRNNAMERAAKLVKLITDKVEQDRRNYHTFIGILMDNRSAYRDVLECLNSVYTHAGNEDPKPTHDTHDHEKHAYGIEDSKPTHNEQRCDLEKLDHKESEHNTALIRVEKSYAFRCPCGICSLDSYLEDGCPKSNSKTFPFLDLSKVDDCDKENMIQQLSDQTSAIQEAFDELFYGISKSLSSRAVTTEQLALRVLAHRSRKLQRSLWEEYKDKLCACPSINNSFAILRKCVTFFNYELLEWIIKCGDLCTEEDRKQFLDYQKMFEKFCRRKVFEVPFNALKSEVDNTVNRTRFAVLLTMEEGEAMLLDAVKAKRKLASLLKLKAGTLHLEWIDQGSLILVFSVPHFVAERLFPLEHCQVLLLKSEEFTIFVPSTIGTGLLSQWNKAVSLLYEVAMDFISKSYLSIKLVEVKNDDCVLAKSELRRFIEGNKQAIFPAQESSKMTIDPPTSKSLDCVGEVCPLPPRKSEVAIALDELSADFTHLIEFIKDHLTEMELDMLKKHLIESTKKLGKEDESYSIIKQKGLDSRTVNELINNLTAQTHWSYMSPETLYTLVKDIKAVQSKVNSYEKKLASFKESAKLKNLAECSFPVPDYCVELKLKLKSSWGEKTLNEAEIDVKNMIKRTVYGYSPNFRLKKLDQGCILIYSLCEEGATKMVINTDRLQELCEQNEVIGVTIDGKVLVDLSEEGGTLSSCKMSLRSLLGEKVLMSGSLSEMPVSLIEREDSVIGLFFSANWCPASWDFTPMLINWYKDFKAGPKANSFDIVFVSSDNDENSWKQYVSKMPWYALDFKDREKEIELSTKFKVNAIPTLVFVDGKTGQLINKNGRSVVTDDPRGEDFPWRPKPLSTIMANARFIGKDKKETTWNELQGKVIAFFFSARWRPESRDFTSVSQLIALYKKLNKDAGEFEVIDVSFDTEEEDWQKYMAFTPWISLHYGDNYKKVICKYLDVRFKSIPALILVNENGAIITTEGWNNMLGDPEGNDFPWYVKRLTKYTADSINEGTSLVWFIPDSLMDRAKAILEPLAKEYFSNKAEKNEEVDLSFFIAAQGDVLTEYLKKFAKLTQKGPLLVIVDVSTREVYTSDRSEITTENAKAFIDGYTTNSLKSRAL